MAAEWHQVVLAFAVAAAAALVPWVMLCSRRQDAKWRLYMKMYRHFEDDPIRPPGRGTR